MAGKAQLQRAINQIQEKQSVPDIDFSQHQLENGYTISTRERVVKEVRSCLRARLFSLAAKETSVR
jgi:hypothetical protein